jgi:hypothetical protein
LNPRIHHALKGSFDGFAGKRGNEQLADSCPVHAGQDSVFVTAKGAVSTVPRECPQATLEVGRRSRYGRAEIRYCPEKLQWIQR